MCCRKFKHFSTSTGGMQPLRTPLHLSRATCQRPPFEQHFPAHQLVDDGGFRSVVQRDFHPVFVRIIILMRLRPAKIHHEAITKVLGDIAIIAFDHVGVGGLVSANDIA